MWYIEGGCDLQFENMAITSNAAGQGGHNDAGFQVAGAQRVLITGTVMTGVLGDCVTVIGLHEANPVGAYPRPT